MGSALKGLMLAAAFSLFAGVAYADKYTDTVTAFKQSPKSSKFFARSYGYVVFPDVGKAGFIVGGEHGDGRVYENGKLVGTASLTEVSFGAQAGAKDFSEIIFFHKKEDFDKFKGGVFQIAGNMEATAITLNASASAGTESSNAEASTKESNAATGGGFNNGVAVFVVAKGGLMAGISVAGQKLKYEALKDE